MIFDKLVDKSDSILFIDSPVNSGLLIDGPLELARMKKTTIVLVEPELTKILSVKARNYNKSVGAATNDEVDYNPSNIIIYMSHDYFFRQFVIDNEIKCDILIVNRNIYPSIILYEHFHLKCKIFLLNCPQIIKNVRRVKLL